MSLKLIAPTPVQPKAMRSPGGVAPAAPIAEAGMIVGNPAVTAAPPTVHLTNSRLLVSCAPLRHLGSKRAHHSHLRRVLFFCARRQFACLAFRVRTRASAPA